MQTDNTIFSIRNLSCAYSPHHKKVIDIHELDIQRGKLLVILGKSGAGKSTILETLGLMNKTLQDQSAIVFSPNIEGSTYNYAEIWKDPKLKHIQTIRKDHFSFIFQSTNLMPNFTAYENVIISLMIQGKGRSESMHLASEIMKMIGLEEVDAKKKTFELSGGQKQRLAFVRAIIPDFTVLFGDEPTGNLDENNSRELLTILKKTISTKNQTAIIVSHNIDLTVEFADQVVVLTKTDDTGEFLKENAFHRTTTNGESAWYNAENKRIDDMAHKIRSLI